MIDQDPSALIKTSISKAMYLSAAVACFIMALLIIAAVIVWRLI